MNPLNIMMWRLSAPISVPTEAATRSLPAITRIESPSGELTRFWASTIIAMHVPHTTGRKLKSLTSLRPKSVSGAMPVNPFGPPVKSRSSTSPIWTMIPNASVAIARWWPLRRNTSAPIQRAITATMSAARMMSSQGLSPK
jgi:hypothetical protein